MNKSENKLVDLFFFFFFFLKAERALRLRVVCPLSEAMRGLRLRAVQARDQSYLSNQWKKCHWGPGPLESSFLSPPCLCSAAAGIIQGGM